MPCFVTNCRELACGLRGLQEGQDLYLRVGNNGKQVVGMEDPGLIVALVFGSIFTVSFWICIAVDAGLIKKPWNTENNLVPPPPARPPAPYQPLPVYHPTDHAPPPVPYQPTLPVYYPPAPPDPYRQAWGQPVPFYG